MVYATGLVLTAAISINGCHAQVVIGLKSAGVSSSLHMPSPWDHGCILIYKFVQYSTLLDTMTHSCAQWAQ